ncbi:type I pullulanase [Orenia metallireducens]|uniref:Pullulanase, type I n=1 Tax=Orenia metallireducens TaxID=1413210 RepID=A0A285H541_9FIRM|nr:alpha-amylase family glycosyl hydrolase [Orenia metallireducens]PRX28632.1 type I pullulanase [Orenia metallireducens]SNY30919.1 pullulanase, type I [Orenia metallireducens]
MQSIFRRNKLLLVSLLLVTLFTLVGCSSSGDDVSEVTTGTSKLNVIVADSVSIQAVTDDFTPTSIEVVVTNESKAEDTDSQTASLDDGKQAFSFNDLMKGVKYNVTVNIKDEKDYTVFTDTESVLIKDQDNKVTLTPKVADAEGIIVNFKDIPVGSSGEVVLLPINESADIVIDANLARASIKAQIPGNDYTLQVKLDGEVVKEGEISLLPGRVSVVKDTLDLNDGIKHLGEIETTWQVPGPALSVDDKNGDFVGALNLTLYVDKNVTEARYTTDGSDPQTGTSFEYGEDITIGEGAAIGDKVVLKLYAKNASGGETIQEYSYTKAYDEAIPSDSNSTMPLGAVYTPEYTSFRIWSPDSSDVKVIVDGQEYDCTLLSTFEAKGFEYRNVYHAKVEGDLAGKEYQFIINGNKVRDPYGVMVKYDEDLATGAEGDSRQENGADLTVNTGSSANIVMDLGKADISWSRRPELVEREDAVIYEMHVRDFTIADNSGVSADRKGKFSGMVESGTTIPGTDVKTGIDHLKELGVTHVQIMPFYDFATKLNHDTGQIYNWGYDPINYNVPEDRYSMSPDDYEKRIEEVKTMINKFHEAGIRVVMDVVYNHSYDKEMFRDITGEYYTENDLSGCGNSIDTGERMVSQMILDSLDYWVDQYNIDGFRFDLMGIYHTDEVKRWADYLDDKYADRNLLIYGEPWAATSDDLEDEKIRKGHIYELEEQHVGVFNDSIRNAIRGEMNQAGGGYIFGNGGAEDIMIGLKGSLADGVPSGPWAAEFTYDPEQTINYMSAHDNLCIGDKIKADIDAGNIQPADAMSISKLGIGVVLTSQGIPFIHGGDEMLRQKDNGTELAEQAHNSYMWGDSINKVDWNWKQEHKELFDYYKALIQLRKDHKAFRLTEAADINEYVNLSNDGDVIISMINGDEIADEDWGDIVVVYNPDDAYNYSLPTGTWRKVFDNSGSVNEVISDNNVTVESRSITIFEGTAEGDLTPGDGTDTEEDVVYTHWKLTFDPALYDLDPAVIADVHLAGGMNGWDSADHTYDLVKQDDGTWTATWSVDELIEETEFKWIVDGEWTPGGTGNNLVVENSQDGIEGVVQE